MVNVPPKRETNGVDVRKYNAFSPNKPRKKTMLIFGLWCGALPKSVFRQVPKEES